MYIYICIYIHTLHIIHCILYIYYKLNRFRPGTTCLRSLPSQESSFMDDDEIEAAARSESGKDG